MKNLKRALSLVLSTAMLAGMMMVSTGAAFADVKAEHNEEAIAVVSAAGIMGANEEFNPDANITRNEMAVVMVNMLGLDTKDYAGASNFTDVPAWAADYVDACYANGIVSGVSATQYNGGANVTTAEAALMMLKALGYFEEKAINDWMLDTIKQASKIDLLDDIDAKASAKLTRNEVAQLCLNALETEWVVETATGSNTSVKGENFEITVDSSVYTEGQDELLLNKLFDDRFEKTEKGKTNLGLPAVVWYDNKEKETIIKAAKEADEVLVSDTTSTSDKKYTALDLYLDEVDEDFEEAMNELELKAGDVVYYYENEDDSIDAYSVTYELVKIKKIDKDMNKAQIKDGYSFRVELDNGAKVYDTDFAGFDYAKNDYVLVVMGENKDGLKVVYASELAETVEGKITAKKSGEFIIDGEGYENLSETELSVKDELTAVLNKAGQIIKVTELNEAVKSDDFAYIYNTSKVDGDTNADGVEGAGDLKVYVVLADGTKASYIVEEDSEALIEKGDVVAYSINKDGEFEVEESDLTVAEAKTALSSDKKYVENGKDKVYANSKTEFVFMSWNDKGTKLTATTATGIKNVEINANMFVVYDADDDEALYVFVEAEDEGVESDVEYAVLMDAADEYTLTVDEDDNEYYTYNVVVAGKETTLTFEKTLEEKVVEGQIFAFNMDGDYAVVSTNEYELVDGTVTYVGENFIEVDGAEYTVADDAELYVHIEVKNAKGETTGFEVTEADELAKKDVIKFIANKDDEITFAFVMEIDD